MDLMESCCVGPWWCKPTAGGANPQGLLWVEKLKEAAPGGTRGGVEVVDVSAVERGRISSGSQQEPDAKSDGWRSRGGIESGPRHGQEGPTTVVQMSIPFCGRRTGEGLWGSSFCHWLCGTFVQRWV